MLTTILIVIAVTGLIYVGTTLYNDLIDALFFFKEDINQVDTITAEELDKKFDDGVEDILQYFEVVDKPDYKLPFDEDKTNKNN